MTNKIVAYQGNNLKVFRQAAGLPLWGLAVRAKASASTLSAVEKWGYTPGPDLCRRIADALDVTVADIWPDASKPSDNHD